MPSRRQEGVAVDSSLCRRCQLNEPAITVRTEPLCNTCFGRYVTTKVAKRMEGFRVRNAEPGQQRTLLVPLSLGACSVSLLHILSQHLKAQAERTGRIGYKLHVLHVAFKGIESSLIEQFQKIKDKYSDHTYSMICLSDVLTLRDIPQLFGLHSSDAENNSDELLRLFASLTSVTSRTDVCQILLRKLIVHFAREHACHSILWAHSTTKLAERTLAETAKGRGLSLPWTVADGKSTQDVVSYYPMQDLLSKEIISFSSMTEPPLSEFITVEPAKVAVSTKNTTIDDLMRQYFESVEVEYPSIVANVVKTTGKLQTISLDNVEKYCELCDMPLDAHAPEKSRLCYGCIRTLSGVRSS